MSPVRATSRSATLFTRFALSLATLGCARSERASLEGVRLGMTAPEVRSEFRPGEWSTSTTEDGTVLLDWAPSAHSDVRAVRFELHQSVLVAIRAQLGPNHPQAGDPSLISSDVVRQVTIADDDTVQVLWITRNCPIHHDEVEALLSTL